MVEKCPYCGSIDLEYYIVIPEVTKGTKIAKCKSCGEDIFETNSAWPKAQLVKTYAQIMAEQHRDFMIGETLWVWANGFYIEVKYLGEEEYDKI
jgi:hypothetical protein